MLAVQLSNYGLFGQVFKTKAAMIIIVLVVRLMRDVSQELPLHQLLYLDLELEPAERICRRNMIVPPAIVDHQSYNGRLDNDEENDNEEGDREEEHQVEEDSRSKGQLLSLDVFEVECWKFMLCCHSQDIKFDKMVAWQVVALLTLSRYIGLTVNLRIGTLILHGSLADVHLDLNIIDNYLELNECTCGKADCANRPFLLRVDSYLVFVLVKQTRCTVIVAFQQLIELEVVMRYLVILACGCGDGLKVMVKQFIHLLGTQLLLVEIHFIGIDQVVEDRGHR